MGYFFFFKQKTAYEMRISNWSSDVCSSDLATRRPRMALSTSGASAVHSPTTSAPTRAAAPKAATNDDSPTTSRGASTSAMVRATSARLADFHSVAVRPSSSHRTPLSAAATSTSEAALAATKLDRKSVV